MHLLDSIDRWVLAIVLPQLSDGLKLSEVQAGWLSTVLLLAFAISSPPIGYVADRIEASPAAGHRFRNLEPGNGRDRAGPILSSTSSGPRGGGRRRSDLRGRGPDDPDGLVSAHDPWPGVGVASILAMPVGAALGLCLGVAFADVRRLAVGIFDRGCSRRRFGSGRAVTAGPGPRDE